MNYGCTAFLTRNVADNPFEGLWGVTMNAIGSVLYVCGGQSNYGLSNRVYTFDTLSSEWSQAGTEESSMSAKYFHRSTVAGEFLYVFGGFNGQGLPTNKLEKFDPFTNEWTQLSNPDHPNSPSSEFSCGGIFEYQGLIYVRGYRNHVGEGN
jgi:hypothetical protein